MKSRSMLVRHVNRRRSRDTTVDEIVRSDGRVQLFERIATFRVGGGYWRREIRRRKNVECAASQRNSKRRSERTIAAVTVCQERANDDDDETKRTPLRVTRHGSTTMSGRGSNVKVVLTVFSGTLGVIRHGSLSERHERSTDGTGLEVFKRLRDKRSKGLKRGGKFITTMMVRRARNRVTVVLLVHSNEW